MIDTKMFTEQQLKDAALIYFKGDDFATNVWIKKYALRSKTDGFYEELTPDDTINRITKEIHREELKHPNPLSYEEIHETLDNFRYFIFGGSILFGLGNNNAVSSLGNCFFIDNGADSYGGIFNLDESMVQLMKRRGGVGITIENWRPSSAYVNNSAHSSTGGVSFMNRFSNSTREVAQDGRRGALMLSCSINYTDVDQFILSKDDLTKITGANISVKITDKFMNSVERDEDYYLTWPCDENKIIKEQIPYNKLIKLEDGSYVKKVKAKDLWNLIIKQAHKNAEPGVLFWDTIIRESPADCYKKHGFVTLGTNPCISGDALIKTNLGELTIPQIISIKNENKNIQALTYNEETQQLEFNNIEVAQQTKQDTNIIEIEAENGDKLKLTPDHKVFTENRGWVEAAKLNDTDILLII